tara:strand:- start:5335 stop:5661 length:327 start_codon:yes stop_codon:yes gene_type:complete
LFDYEGISAVKKKPTPTVTIEKRGLNRKEAAAYIGLSETKFAELVRRDMMPQPKAVGRRRIYDRREIDEAFDNFPTESQMVLEGFRNDGEIAERYPHLDAAQQSLDLE